MSAPKGNKYWHFRNKHGRDFEYTPDALWEEAVKYFDWVENNPLKEQKGFAFQGVVTKSNFKKMRAMSLKSFCIFADITFKTFENYTNNKDFIHITTRIKEIIESQQFEGAAAELLNPNIIARKLGLSENTKNETTKVKLTLTPEERAERIAALKAKL